MKVREFDAAFLLGLSANTAHAAPLQYLSGAGEKAAPVVALTWGVLLVSFVVIVLIGILLVGAILRRRPIVVESTVLEKDEGGQNWLWIGTGITALVLLVTVVWTVIVLADIQSPGNRPAATIEVTGRQWWWQVRYIGENGAQGFSTANEIHIPVGQPVRLKLMGGDVIHSFWVPQLAGKMDAIPGQINETWIEANAPGTYSGQCTEYCGVQHSKMLLRVVAQSPRDFRAWWAHQLAVPAVAADRTFIEHCGGCHTVRGTDANGTFGPDLSHLMQRRTLASGTLPNDAATLASWIADPQALKPGNRMPAVKLSPDDCAQIVAWLRTLS
jgi:cytochrome c oxidase subunit 2